MSSWQRGIVPKPPGEPVTGEQGGCSNEDWRRLHDWKYRLWEADENPALIEWGTPEEMNHYRFIRWLIERGDLSEQE